MDHVCDFQKIQSEILYECINCIDEIKDQRTRYTFDCKCITRNNMNMHCIHCFEIQKKINALNDYLEILLITIKNDIKNCINCSTSINEIHDISKQIRKYTFILQEQKLKYLINN
jgi:hypothetical protein